MLVATHDLVAGQLLDPADVIARGFPVDLVPAGAVLDVGALTARRLAGAMRAGEPLTDARLVGPSLLRGLAGQVAVPVRVADAETAELVHPGDRVDVVAPTADAVGQPLDSLGTGSAGSGSAGSGSTGADSTAGGVLAVSALVLAVPAPVLDSTSTAGRGGWAGGSGTLVVLAVPAATATRLAQASAPVTLLLRVTP